MLFDTISYVSGADWNYDIAGSTLSTPSDDDVIVRFEAVRAFDLPANLTGLSLGAGTLPTSSATFKIQKNGSDVTNATFSIASGGGVTLGTNSAESFAIGDVLSVVITAVDSGDDFSLTVKTLAP